MAIEEGYDMNEEGFHNYLKKGGRSQSAINRVMRYVSDFEAFLSEERNGKSLDQAELDDLEHFVAWIEKEPKASAKGHLWGLAYYYDYNSNNEMRHLAGVLREQRIKRTPFPLHEFRGVNPTYAEKLAAVGIKNVNQMLKKGRTLEDRKELSEKTGIPLEAILEFVKLSDLSRIPGVKGTRARLYVDAGVDTIEKMAQWDPGELREMIVEFVERTGFEGIATLPAEARSAVRKAKEMPRIVEYE
jgi:hypothetical protein